jgi:hypothetical protein
MHFVYGVAVGLAVGGVLAYFYLGSIEGKVERLIEEIRAKL